MGTNTKKSDLAGGERKIEGLGEGRSRLATARAGAFYLPLLLAGMMTVLFLTDLLTTLVTGWTAEGGAELGGHRLHVMGIAAVVAVFLLGLFAQVYQPKKRVASVWGAFITILWAVAFVVTAVVLPRGEIRHAPA